MTHIRFTYKTGKYFGRLFAERPQGLVVEVLAVEKHPVQGDLHQPNQVDVPLFHIRTALHKHEKITVSPQSFMHMTERFRIMRRAYGKHMTRTWHVLKD